MTLVDKTGNKIDLLWNGYAVSINYWSAESVRAWEKESSQKEKQTQDAL